MPEYLWTWNYSYYYFSEYIVLYLSSHYRVCCLRVAIEKSTFLTSWCTWLFANVRYWVLHSRSFTAVDHECRPHFSSAITLTESRDLPMRFLCTKECQIENNDLIFKNNPFVSMISVSGFIIAIVVIIIMPSNLSLLSPGFLTSMFMHIISHQLSAFW